MENENTQTSKPSEGKRIIIDSLVVTLLIGVMLTPLGILGELLLAGFADIASFFSSFDLQISLKKE